MAQSTRDLFDGDARGDYANWHAFDDALWMRVHRIEDEADVPRPVLHYFASRLIEWQVGNGGFAQAAMNYPEWFDTAAQGFEAIGWPAIGVLVREAGELSKKERHRLDKALAGGVEDAFAYFREEHFAKFDERYVEIDWDAVNKSRLDYARRHRAEFERFDEM